MNTELLIALIPGLLITFLMIGIYKTMFEKKEMTQDRLGKLSGEVKENSVNSILGKKNTGELLKKRKKKKNEALSFIDKLEIDLERANLMLSSVEFILISIAVGGVVFTLSTFVFGLHPALSVLIGIISTCLPKLFIKVKIMMRMKKAAREFSDVLDSMVNGFKTGYGFTRAVQMIADNYKDPWGTEFGKMAAEMNLGLTQEDALFNLSSRVPSQDVDLFVTALLIQKETGGNMSELLGTLSKTCRDRYKLFQKVGAISAQGKLSAGIVCCVPFVLAGMMFLFLPAAMGAFISNPIGIILMVLAGIWMVIGIGVLYKIVQIEV